MRNLITLMLLTTAGCAVGDDPATTTTASDLSCGSFCDPDDPLTWNDAVDAIVHYGSWTFPGSVPVAPPSCENHGTAQAPDFECIQQIYISQNPCGPVAISCFRHGCDYKILNYCH